MPNFNDGKYIKEALDSLLNQSFKNFEILIIDDGSTDNSLDIIKEYEKNHKNIKIVQNLKNYGVIYSINKGISLAKGSFLTFNSADDKVLPDYFVSLMDFFQKKPELQLIVSDPMFFNESEKKVMSLLPLKEPLMIAPDQIIKIFRKTKFWIPSHSTIYRTAVVKKYGGQNNKLFHHADWYLNLQIAFNEFIGYVPRGFCLMRIRQDSFSSINGRDKKIYKGLFSSLMIEMQNSDLKNEFKRSGVLTQLGWNFFFFFAFQYEIYIISFLLAS